MSPLVGDQNVHNRPKQTLLLTFHMFGGTKMWKKKVSEGRIGALCDVTEGRFPGLGFTMHFLKSEANTVLTDSFTQHRLCEFSITLELLMTSN